MKKLTTAWIGLRFLSFVGHHRRSHHLQSRARRPGPIEVRVAVNCQKKTAVSTKIINEILQCFEAESVDSFVRRP